jgi:hypothetical protein
MSSGGEADVLHYYYSFSKSNYLRLFDCFCFVVHVRPVASSSGRNGMLVTMYDTLQGKLGSSSATRRRRLDEAA